MLAHFSLEKKVCGMMDFGGWNRLLSIVEPVCYDVTLEVLSTFEVDKIPVRFSRLGAIQF